MLEMQTMWIMIENTMNAILTYGMESFKMRKQDYDELNRIQLKGIRILLNIPENVANEIIIAETGMDQIDLIIKRNRIIYDKELRSKFNEEENNNCKMLSAAHKTFESWRKRVEQDKIDLELEDSDMLQTSECLKKKVKENMRKIMKKRIIAAATSKSTVRNYINNLIDNKEEVGTRKIYIDNLTRYQVRNTIISRAKRLQTKMNHRYKHQDKYCRWCRTCTETDDHILRKCRKHPLASRDFKGLYGEKNKEEWKHLAETISKLIKSIKQKEDEGEKNKKT